MNVSDILKYGDLTFTRSLRAIPPEEWETSGVCGVWSVKDIVAHLASHEHILEDVLNSFLDGGATPYLSEYIEIGLTFNDVEVEKRQDKSREELLNEYKQAVANVAALVPRIPPETWQQPGTLPWYGAEYALDDFIVYGYYGHKREHAAQVDVFKDLLKAQQNSA